MVNEQAEIIARAIKIRLDKCLENNWSDWLYSIHEEWDFETSEELDDAVVELLSPLMQELNK
jgi:hypothetical protein